MKLTEELANKVYDVLEEIGASPLMRNVFIYSQTHEDIHEWRFQGKLGFGGKFWNEWSYLNDQYMWRVSCYSEDENKSTLSLIDKTNKKLVNLINEISAR